MTAKAKTCFKCGAEKPPQEFYRHPGMADGRLGKCKVCTRKDVQENRAAKRDYYNAYDKARLTKERVEKMIAAIPAHVKSARRAVANARKRGDIVKPGSCDLCGVEVLKPRELHAHHWDYYRPLDISWLCRTCHGKVHRFEIPGGTIEAIRNRHAQGTRYRPPHNSA